MSNVSPKIFQTGAFKPELSLDGNLHKGWGNQPAGTITTADGIPYISFTHKPTINREEDNQITGNAFKTASIITGQYYEGTMEVYDKWEDLNSFILFNFQWEERVLQGFIARGTPDQPANLEIGETVNDGTNDWTLQAVGKSRDINGDIEYLYFLEGVSAIPAQTGTLTGTSTNTVTMNSNSATYVYRHRYALDKEGRNLRDFTTAEKTALGSHVVGDDQKSPFATVAKRINNAYDIVYANSLCTGFELSCKAANFWMLKPEVMAPRQLRTPGAIPDGTQATCEAIALANAPAHYQTVINLGLYDQPMTEYGVTDFMVKTETPVQKLQTTVSGKSLAEPYLEGKVDIKGSFTIGRHEKKEFQDYRDGNTRMHGEVIVTRGFDMQILHIKQFTLDEAGPDESDVAAEPLEMSINWDCADVLFNDLNNSPILFDVFDDNPNNSMTNRP